MLFISKQQLVPTIANHMSGVHDLEDFSKHRLQVGQLKWYGLFPVMLMSKMTVVFITHAFAVRG